MTPSALISVSMLSNFTETAVTTAQCSFLSTYMIIQLSWLTLKSRTKHFKFFHLLKNWSNSMVNGSFEFCPLVSYLDRADGQPSIVSGLIQTVPLWYQYIPGEVPMEAAFPSLLRKYFFPISFPNKLYQVFSLLIYFPYWHYSICHVSFPHWKYSR